MAGNTAPIYSRQGEVQGGDLLTTGSNTYTGNAVSDTVVFTADATNGSYVQRLRFKAVGATGGATVARVWVNNGSSKFATSLTTPGGTPTGTFAASGGSLTAGNYYCKIVAVDPYGGRTAPGTESAAVAATGSTGQITWNWTAVTNAVSYRIYVGYGAVNSQLSYFTANTNSYVQTALLGTKDNFSSVITANNNLFIGEISLPSITASATAATVDIDYPLNFALPPGYRIIVGLATTVTAGWLVTAVGGDY